MKPEHVRKYVQGEIKKIENANARIRETQAVCGHETAIRSARCQDDEYGRPVRYLYDYKCPDCLKFWTTNQ